MFRVKLSIKYIDQFVWLSQYRVSETTEDKVSALPQLYVDQPLTAQLLGGNFQNFGVNRYPVKSDQ